jgi:hypothetical protein
MTMLNLLIALGVGSALIAFWFVLRYPGKCPEDFSRALMHVFAAFAIGWFAPDVFNAIAAYGIRAAFFGIFVLLLPVLIYTFLSGAWFLKLVADMVNHYRH